MVDEGREFHGVDRQLDIHVALHLAAAGGIGEFAQRLRHDRETVVIEQSTSGRIEEYS